jgi:8-oxo-dGTP diphosphatase
VPADDGNGFVRCTCGHLHWGKHGAAGLLLSDPDRGVLLQRRAWWTHHGRTWALPGGAVRRGETAWETAVREAAEEAAVPAAAVHPTAESLVDHGPWRYTTVLATVRHTVEERSDSFESAELRWVPPGDVARYRLHRDFAKAWPGLLDQIDREVVLVVDGANVVGARPDGWWRDRAGAATRLRDRLAGLTESGVGDAVAGVLGRDDWLWWPRIVLVVEGQARHTEPVDGVEVVSTPRDGDTTIVETVRTLREDRPGDHVFAVTADRELRGRVTSAGGDILGPGTLLGLLDEVS